MKRRTMAFGGLLMAVAITTYSVCGTYAKYISSLDFADEARVAKWNFELVGDKTESNYDIHLFEDSYTITGTGTNKIVSSEPGIKVVAPGAEGSYAFSVAGTAETNYTVSMTAKITNEIKTTDDEGIEYNPIRFSIDGGTTWMTDTELEAKLNALTNNTTVYPANYELKDTDIAATIQWKWLFDESYLTDDLKAAGFVSNDELDTELARKQGNITVSIGLTVTQSDKDATITTTKAARFTKLPEEAIPVIKADPKLAAFDENKIANVKFNGKSLTGSIEINEDLKSAYAAGEDTGYYFPIVVTGEVGTEVQVYGGTEHVADEDGVIVLTQLHPEFNKEDKKINVTVDGKDYIIDYSNLNFNK